MKSESEFGRDVAYEATVSMRYANLVAALLLPAVFLLLYMPFRWIWGGQSAASATVLRLPAWWLSLLALLLSVVVHELLHAAGFLLFGRAPVSAVKFGVAWKALAVYAHCQEPMTARAYRYAVALPGLVLGIVPSILALSLGLWPLLLWGGVMIVAAGGDLAALLAVRSVPAAALVRDHPAKVGCLVLNQSHQQ